MPCPPNSSSDAINKKTISCSIDGHILEANHVNRSMTYWWVIQCLLRQWEFNPCAPQKMISHLQLLHNHQSISSPPPYFQQPIPVLSEISEKRWQLSLEPWWFAWIPKTIKLQIKSTWLVRWKRLSLRWGIRWHRWRLHILRRSHI